MKPLIFVLLCSFPLFSMQNGEYPPDPQKDPMKYHIYCLLVCNVKEPHLRKYVQNPGDHELISVPKGTQAQADLAKKLLRELPSAEYQKILYEIMKEKIERE